MISIVEADGKKELALLEQLSARNSETDRLVTASVQEIIENVRNRGDAAVMEYTRRFDRTEARLMPIGREELAEIADACEKKIYSALKNAASNIEEFHARQVQQSWFTTQENGIINGQRIRGLCKVGIYVPGGTAAYPSSVLMNAIPARIAGVQEIIMVTPPSKDGGFNAAVMAAAYIAGVDKVYLCGGAQAVAALAYGTQSIEKVDKIVGPGNIYVATAKRLLFGLVDIDMIAGPSEILIIADDTAEPSYLAADMMSQAEHDPLASSILVTTSMEIAEQTIKEIEHQIKNLSRAEIILRSLKDYGAVIVCRNMDQAVNLANRLAPEHLEVMCDQPMAYLGRLNNAGSIFLGKYSPEPLGDYYAGPNHVLPTSGTARFFSPLSVDSFLKKTSFISYSQQGLKLAQDDIITLAEAEGLDAHANSIQVRFQP
ncbi:MAG TPA: histidinol dehydrogenase [Ruminococcaceae bacterium]|nr:histidinol dehydrogenase [Oscillospiraceae bacterium]